MTVEEVATLQETLQQVRNRGFATVSDAHSAYAYGAAAPIRDVRGVVIAAINVTAPSARFHPASDQVVKEVVRAAASISNELSGNSPL
jgi:DNA-binding IclR family transcriptional regulator